MKCKDCDYFLEHKSVKDTLIKYNLFYKNYSNNFDEELKKIFKNTFKFSSNNINKFISLWRKGVYPYEYMNDW